MFYLASQLAFYLADNVCVLPNKTQLCVLPCKTQFCTSAPDTVIPGQDQGLISMTAQSQQDHEAIIIKTQEQKNTNNAHSSIRAETSFCPYIRMSIMTKKNCSAKHCILKRNKRKNLLFFITKESQTQHRRCKHLRSK